MLDKTGRVKLDEKLAATASELVALALWERRAIRIAAEAKPFKLTSGNYSPLYVDCRSVTSHPASIDTITALMHGLLQRKNLTPDVLAGGETAGIPYASFLASRLALPMVYVRKTAATHGRRRRVEGDVPTNASVLLVEDLVTDGKSKLSFVEGLRHEGAVVATCVVVLDRLQGGAAVLAQADVTLLSLTDIEVALRVGLEAGVVTEDEAQSVERYRSDPAAWHKERGLEFLVDAS